VVNAIGPMAFISANTTQAQQISTLGRAAAMIREVFFAILALVLTLAMVAWVGDGPRLAVQTIEASAGR